MGLLTSLHLCLFPTKSSVIYEKFWTANAQLLRKMCVSNKEWYFMFRSINLQKYKFYSHKRKLDGDFGWIQKLPRICIFLDSEITKMVKRDSINFSFKPDNKLINCHTLYSIFAWYFIDGNIKYKQYVLTGNNIRSNWNIYYIHTDWILPIIFYSICVYYRVFFYWI